MRLAGHVYDKNERPFGRDITLQKQGRPRLRREDSRKRDQRKAESEEEKWIEKANNRDQWKTITKVAVQRSDE